VTAVDEVRYLIKGRLGEVDDEPKRLRRALNELGDGERRKRPGRPSGRRSGPQRATKEAGRRRRSRKGGTRSEDALLFIEKHPGSKAGDIAQALKIKPSYMYRVLGDLSKDGKVEKKGTAYWASK
jgi:hypothetical protein